MSRACYLVAHLTILSANNNFVFGQRLINKKEEEYSKNKSSLSNRPFIFLPQAR